MSSKLSPSFTSIASKSISSSIPDTTSPATPAPTGTSILLNSGLITPSATIANIEIVISCFIKFLIRGISCQVTSTPSRVDIKGALVTVSLSPLSSSMPTALVISCLTSSIFSSDSGCATSRPVSGSMTLGLRKRTAALIFSIFVDGAIVVATLLLTS